MAEQEPPKLTAAWTVWGGKRIADLQEKLRKAEEEIEWQDAEWLSQIEDDDREIAGLKARAEAAEERARVAEAVQHDLAHDVFEAVTRATIAEADRDRLQALVGEVVRLGRKSWRGKGMGPPPVAPSSREWMDWLARAQSAGAKD